MTITTVPFKITVDLDQPPFSRIFREEADRDYLAPYSLLNDHGGS